MIVYIHYNATDAFGEAPPSPGLWVNVESIQEMSTDPEDYALMQDLLLSKKQEQDSKKSSAWESIFPSEGFQDDILALRPDLVLFHDVEDPLAVFKTHQDADPEVQRAVRILKEMKCTCGNGSSGCVHDEGCARNFFCISPAGVLIQRRLGKPMEHNASAIEIIDELLANPCTCSWAHLDSSCLHHKYSLTDRPVRKATRKKKKKRHRWNDRKAKPKEGMAKKRRDIRPSRFCTAGSR